MYTDCSAHRLIVRLVSTRCCNLPSHRTRKIQVFITNFTNTIIPNLVQSGASQIRHFSSIQTYFFFWWYWLFPSNVFWNFRSKWGWSTWIFLVCSKKSHWFKSDEQAGHKASFITGSPKLPANVFLELQAAWNVRTFCPKSPHIFYLRSVLHEFRNLMFRKQ